MARSMSGTDRAVCSIPRIIVPPWVPPWAPPIGLPTCQIGRLVVVMYRAARFRGTQPPDPSMMISGGSIVRHSRAWMIFLLLVLCLTVGISPARAGPDDDAALVQTASGLVRGIVDGDYRWFQGIPFAAAPVGELRF